METTTEEKPTMFSNFPLLFDGKGYRIPDPNLSRIFGDIVPYDTPLEASTPEIERRFSDYVGKRVIITGKIQGWLNNWYPASVITGIKVLEIELATNQSA